jgi:hypothetical protein
MLEVSVPSMDIINPLEISRATIEDFENGSRSGDMSAVTTN